MITTPRYPLRAMLLAIGLAPALYPVSSGAVPVLQVYVEGSTYDDTHESWVFSPDTNDPLRLWVIGNVSGSGGKGTIEDVKISIVYDDPGSAVTVSLTPSTTANYNGFLDPSTPSAPTYVQTVDNGSAPLLGDGSSLSPHGVYVPGAEWQEFGLGDFDLSDSPIGDFIDDFPTTFSLNAGQINVYELTVVGDIADFHIDAYNHVEAGNHAKYVFAPYSHDAGTGVNDPVPIPEPGSIGLFVIGLLGLGIVLRRRHPA